MLQLANDANYYYYFNHPIYLTLHISYKCKHEWLQTLLSLIELAHLEGFYLRLSGKQMDDLNSLLANITILLERAPNIHEFR